MAYDRVPEALKEKWFSRRDAAAELAISIRKLDMMLAGGQLKSRRYVGRRLVSRESVASFLSQYLR